LISSNAYRTYAPGAMFVKEYEPSAAVVVMSHGTA